MLKYIYISLGMISLSIGMLGIVTPMLPTTPFVLLTAFLFARSSPRLYGKLQKNKITGYYLNRLNSGLSVKARIFSISFMWCMISFSAFVILNTDRHRLILLGLGIIGTIAQLIAFRKRKPKLILDQNQKSEDIES